MKGNNDKGQKGKALKFGGWIEDTKGANWRDWEFRGLNQKRETILVDSLTRKFRKIWAKFGIIHRLNYVYMCVM